MPVSGFRYWVSGIGLVSGGDFDAPTVNLRPAPYNLKPNPYNLTNNRTGQVLWSSRLMSLKPSA